MNIFPFFWQKSVSSTQSISRAAGRRGSMLQEENSVARAWPCHCCQGALGGWEGLSDHMCTAGIPGRSHLCWGSSRQTTRVSSGTDRAPVQNKEEAQDNTILKKKKQAK